MSTFRDPQTQAQHEGRFPLPVRVAKGLALAAAFPLLLAGCEKSESPAATSMSEPAPAEVVESTVVSEPVDAAMDAMDSKASLAAVLAAQPDEAKARYPYRHPSETLEFFGIEPGMTVLEALPGGGWYTKVLVPYLGADGTLVGVDYDKAMFPLFGFMDEERLKAKETWPEDWSATARAWFDEDVAAIQAYQFGAMPEATAGSLDAALFIRALHNMARFESDGAYLTTALAETFMALKPGGVVGVVQHMAPEEAPDEWASGSAGYLKKSFVVESMTAAGFELVAESSINENPADQPTVDDVVWRLPPSLNGAADDPELAAERQAIGESNRMTLLFRKPA